MSTTAPETATLSAAGKTAPSAAKWAILAAAFVVLHFVAGLHTALNKSVTHDEIWHLPVGILNLQTGRFDYDVLNPPLTRMWAALPAWIAGVEVELGVDATEIALRFVNGHADYFTWYAWGRGMTLLLSVVTAYLVWMWASSWFGPPAGAFAVALYATCPNIIAHSTLITPEAGITLGFIASLYLLTRWLEAPTWRRACLLGLAIGLSQGMKFTAVLLYPLAIMITLLWPGSQHEGPRRRLPWFVQYFAAGVISLLVWDATYFFSGVGRRVSEFAFESQALLEIVHQFPFIKDAPVPIPADYITGLDRQRYVMEQSHAVYLNGNWTDAGFRSYFLRVLQYKLPHLFQACLVVGTALLLVRRKSLCSLRKQVVFWLPAVALLAIASFSKMQLGVRYVLPAFPLLMLAACPAIHASATFPRGLRVASMSLLFGATLFSLRHHPHHLAYFNELAGGIVGGRKHLVDSNLDWGQDLHLVRDFMVEHEIEKIQLVYFGTLPPEALEIEYEVPSSRFDEQGRPIPGYRFSPGWYAVSVNYVMGRPHTLRMPDGTGRPTGLFEFSDFLWIKPEATLGGSIDIYLIK